MKKRQYPAFVLLVLFIAVILVFSIWTYFYGNDAWFADYIVAIVLILLIYKFRKRFHICNTLLFLLMIGLIMHYIGTFGAYNWTFFGYEYDTIPHLFTPIVVTLILFNHLRRKYPLSLKTVFVLSLFLMLGIAATHELIEYSGYRLFGEGEGMFLYGPGDFGNSSSYHNVMTDLFNNLVGALVACFLSYFWLKLKKH